MPAMQKTAASTKSAPAAHRQHFQGLLFAVSADGQSTVDSFIVAATQMEQASAQTGFGTIAGGRG